MGVYCDFGQSIYFFVLTIGFLATNIGFETRSISKKINTLDIGQPINGEKNE